MQKNNNMSKHFITITDENLYNDIVEYCKLNNEKINIFCQRILKEQLMIEKYGDTPFGKIINDNIIDEINKSEVIVTKEEVLEKYITKEVPKDFQEEIKTEEPKKKKIRRL